MAETVLEYDICNGLSNQLLYHAGPIATAITGNFDVVEVPAYFIVNGVQSSDSNILPSKTNSIPFGLAFDEKMFVRQIKKLGVKVIFKQFDFEQPQIDCSGMTTLFKADARLVVAILDAFQPSAKLQKLISKVKSKFGDVDKAVCLHHRDGADWEEHCRRWGSINDGVYRGNCVALSDISFIENIQNRGLQPDGWIYYCGDHAIPEALLPFNPHTHEVVSSNDLDTLMEIQIDEKRDLYALIDFFVCRDIPLFIGNSVSTFSALQILIRNSDNASWYNSGSVPLAPILNAFSMPIVYTYTELSMASGKFLLQASISSVRRLMPHNPIHILYHGNNDKRFRHWLKEKKVTIHNHIPTWREGN